MNHYTYLIQSLDKTMNYIGSRSCKCDPTEDCYWGTSKHLPWGKKGSKQDQSSQATKTILQVFNTKQEALEHEIYLHNKYSVHTNENFWNQAKQTSTKFDTTGKSFTFTKNHIENMKKSHVFREKSSYGSGWHHSDTAKQAIAKAQAGRIKSESEKDKLSNSLKAFFLSGGKPSMLGKSHNKETKVKISENKKQNNTWKGVTNAKFKPWFIKSQEGNVLYFYSTTKEEQSLKDGYKSHTYGTACNLSKGTTPIKKGKLKGLIIGNIT